MSLLLILLRTHYQVALLFCYSSQNSLPGGSFKSVNTDMKKALSGGYTCVYLDATPIKKKDEELSFHKFSRDVSLREKWVKSIKRKDYIPGEHHRVCSQHFHGAKNQGRLDVPNIFPLLPQSIQKKPPKICLPLEPPAKRKKNETGKSIALADDVVEEVDIFVCNFVSSNERKELCQSMHA